MAAISTVRLPIFGLDKTIGKALDSLKDEGTSAFVVLDGDVPLVVTARALHNTLNAEGYTVDTPMSRVISVAAASQRDFIMIDFDKNYATVGADPRLAIELRRPDQMV